MVATTVVSGVSWLWLRAAALVVERYETVSGGPVK